MYKVETHTNGAIVVSFDGARVLSMQAPRRAAALRATWTRGRGFNGRHFFRLNTDAGHNLGSCRAEHYPAAVEAALAG
jgi:hypothetical protein